MITLVDNVGYFAFSLAIMATTAVILNTWLKKSWLQKVTVALTSLSTVLMLVQLIIRTSQTGRLPVNSVYEFLLLFSFVLLAFSVFWLIKIKLDVVASFILAVATILLGFSFSLSDAAAPLMPALQSLWFVPHVTVYMFSYSLFGCAFLLAVAGLWRHSADYLPSTDRLVAIGMAFLTFGMLSGCFWAKQAWGSYWSWDPKETWAAATWCAYLVYTHRRLCCHRTNQSAISYVWLIVGFALLQMCWYGVNYLPSAQGSMHSYN